MHASLALAILLSLGGAGCVGRALLTDGTSVSLGKPNLGVLRGGRALAVEGPGWVVPGMWRARGNVWGTDELVGAIERAAARVAREHPGGLLGVGDLSRRGGGGMPFHKSHESGRDADLIFYAVDDGDAPVGPIDAMPRYTRRLNSRQPYEPNGVIVPHRRFDLARNWALVRALLEDPEITVEYLFIAEKLKDQLIDWARARGEPEALVRRASIALRQPLGALPHDDHLHLRVACSADDRAQGCVEEGKVRLRSEIYRGPEPNLARAGRGKAVARRGRRGGAGGRAARSAG